MPVIPDYPQPSDLPTAFRSPRALLVWLLPAVVGCALDLYVKAYSFPGGVLAFDPARGTYPPQGRNPAQWHDPWTVIPHVLGFHTTVNRGAVFGSAQGYSAVFVLFSFVALGVITYFFARSRREQWVLHLALGLITAGALGNLYDRLLYGGVRDMLAFYVSWYPFIFNVADALLCIGVPLLMIVWVFAPQAKKS